MGKGLRHFSSEDVQMAQKHRERCSASYVIGETQRKTMMKYHLTPTRTLQFNQKKKTPPKNGKQQVLARMEGNWNPHTLLLGM